MHERHVATGRSHRGFDDYPCFRLDQPSRAFEVASGRYEFREMRTRFGYRASRSSPDGIA